MLSTHQLIHGDVFDVLPSLDHYACCILDPPDGIGLKYAGVKDVKRSQYHDWFASLMTKVIPHAGITWVSFNSIWDLMVKHWAYDYSLLHPDIEIKPFYQHYTFFQCNNNDCAPAQRPILRFRKSDAPIYPDQIRIPSWRLLNGDKRANPRGKTPGDVWSIPRVTGNSKQRRAWHPTQLNEELIERAILLSTAEGDTVLDLFSGTGTVIRVCKRIGRHSVSVELSKAYCQRIAEEHSLEILPNHLTKNTKTEVFMLEAQRA